MKTSFLLSMILISLSIPSWGEDLPLAEDRVLKGVTVLESGIDYLRIRHEGGIATVKANELPADWQEKYKMTAGEVSSRREEARRHEEEKWQRRKESLSESERTPRYLSARDIQTIVSPMANMNALEAEVAAARWNSGEARRLGDKEMVEYYNQSLLTMQPELIAQASRKQRQAEELKKQKEEENVDMKIKLAKYETLVKSQQEENKRLSESLEKSERNNRSTIINTYPNGWNTWNGGVIIRPRPITTIVPPPPPRPVKNVIINTRTNNHTPSPENRFLAPR